MGTVDILNIYGGSVSVGKPNASITLRVGDAASGECFNEATTHFRPAGLVSLPCGPGNFNTSTGVFTASNFSIDCSQAYVIDQTNSHWITEGIRDTRNQNIVSPTAIGESRLFAEGNPKTSVYLDINGNIILTAQNDITMTSVNNVISLISSAINLGTSSPADAAALASKVSTNFSQIATAAQAYLTTAPVTLPQIAGALVTFMTALTTPTFQNTASSVVKISS